MDLSYCILLCLLLATDNAYGFVKRDVAQPSNPNILESLQHNVNQLRESLDQTLAAAVEQVDVKQLQPVFDALGDQVNRFSKVYEALTAPQSTPSSGK